MSYVYTGDGSCRSCSAPLLWFRTPAGKNMPVNDGGAGLPMMDIRDEFTEEEAKAFILPNSHWGSCPDAAKFRKPRE